MQPSPRLLACLVVLAAAPSLHAQGPAPAAQAAYLKASNAETQDWFGNTAVSGDTLVVGAPGEDSLSSGVGGSQGNDTFLFGDPGAVYVFVRSGGAFAQQAYLKASNPQDSARFGTTISISGDTLAVGAPRERSSATGVNGDQTATDAQDSGAVYVFVRDGGSWTQQAYVKASNTDAGDAFGISVSLSGDTLIVGAPGEESGATGVDGDQADDSVEGSGAAYVFVRTGTTWTQQAYLKGTELMPFPTQKGFGTSVSADGDRVLVGAPTQGEQVFGTRAGRAYLFTRSGTTWTQEALLRASNAGSVDDFGCSVALQGDTAVVGARHEDSAATGVNGDQADDTAGQSGAVYVFARDGSGWSQEAYLKASNTGALDRFGSTVALSGGLIVVGALREDSSATGIDGDGSDDATTDSGAAYVFTRAAGRWSQRAFVKASNTGSADLFGTTVAADGETVLIGASGEASAAVGVGGNQADDSAPSAGAVYVLDVLAAATFCSGDDGGTACPCANPGVGGAGCDNAAGTGGVALDASGLATQGNVALEGSGFPPASRPTVVALRSPSAAAPASPFGDGVLCLGGGAPTRVAVGRATGGAVELPIGHAAGPGEFYYQLVYRSGPAAFCTPASFNLSNGLAIVWPQ